MPCQFRIRGSPSYTGAGLKGSVTGWPASAHLPHPTCYLPVRTKSEREHSGFVQMRPPSAQGSERTRKIPKRQGRKDRERERERMDMSREDTKKKSEYACLVICFFLGRERMDKSREDIITSKSEISLICHFFLLYLAYSDIACWFSLLKLVLTYITT